MAFHKQLSPSPGPRHWETMTDKSPKARSSLLHSTAASDAGLNSMWLLPAASGCSTLLHPALLGFLQLSSLWLSSAVFSLASFSSHWTWLGSGLPLPLGSTWHFPHWCCFSAHLGAMAQRSGQMTQRRGTGFGPQG